MPIKFGSYDRRSSIFCKLALVSGDSICLHEMGWYAVSPRAHAHPEKNNTSKTLELENVPDI